MNLVFFITATALTLATLLPLTRGKQWWIRAWDFPRLQVVALAAAWLLCSFVLFLFGKPLSPTLIVVVVLVALYQASWIYPYSTLHSLEAPDTSEQSFNTATIRILVSNVLMTNRNSSKLKSLINEYSPDVFATLERKRI